MNHKKKINNKFVYFCKKIKTFTMKKFILIFILTILSFVSCSKSEDVVQIANQTPSNTNALILCNKYITTNTVSGLVTTTNVTYNGNKIVETNTGTNKQIFTYNGDLITKVETFNSNVVSRITDYVYNSDGKLVSTLKFTTGNPNKSKVVYTYNTNGTINFIESSINISTSVETVGNSGMLTVLNSNIIKKESQTPVLNGNSSGFILIYEYDNKNRPFKNVTGFSKLLDLTDNGQNNLTKTTSTSSNNGVTNPSSSITLVSFTYNSDNYPTETKGFFNGAQEFTTQYFY
jgi:hypothetical protein